MYGTSSSLGTPERLSGSGTPAPAPEVEPAWRPWLRLLELALRAVEDDAWSRAVPPSVADRAPDVPLLDGATVHVDARRVRRLVRELLREADRSVGEGNVRPPTRRRLDTLAVLRGGVAQDADMLERSAAAAGVDAGRLAVVAQLAAMPLLRACALHLRGRIPPDWMKGYCPICGAWPALAELRGLERNRRLRCGRCGSDWPSPVLRCTFCDELRHDRLRTLLPEGEEQARRVDACDSCHGYLKTFSMLQPLPLDGIATTDVGSIELDIVAQERGYARPSRPGYPISITVVRDDRQATTAEASP